MFYCDILSVRVREIYDYLIVYCIPFLCMVARYLKHMHKAFIG